MGQDTTITFKTKSNYVLDASSVKITINDQKLKLNTDYTITNNTIKINGSAVTANKIYVYAKATIQSSKQKGTVEIDAKASKENITVKATNIVVGEESSFELNLPEGTKITAMTLQNGNAILTYPDDFSIVDNVITIPGTKVTNTTVVVTSITLEQKSVTGVELDIGTSKDVYLNETFNVTATATFDSDTETIDWVYNSNYLSMTSSTSVSGETVQIKAIAQGTTTLQAGCNGKWTSCTINISEKAVTVTGIEATLTNPTKTYKEGDTFTTSDLEVRLIYNNGESKSDPISFGNQKSVGDYYQIGYDSGKEAIDPWYDFGTNGHTITSAEVGTTLELKVQYKEDTEITDSFSIQAVETDLTKITLDQSSLNLSTVQEPYSYTLKPTFEPSTATHKDITWSSSDDNVAKVATDGTVTAIGYGQCTITCKSTKYDVKATCSVKVDEGVVHVTGITVNPTTLDVYKGKTGTITPTVTPDNATNKNVTWSSDHEDIATVSDGVVTGVADGSATITATTVDGSYSATCNVTVTTYVAPSGITINGIPSQDMEIGDTAQLSATITPSGAPQTVTWQSSKTDVATIDTTGKVTAIAAGSTDIICTSTVDSSVTTTRTITVAAAKEYYLPVEYETPSETECMITAGADFFSQTTATIPATITTANGTKNVTGIADSGFAQPGGITSTLTQISFENADQITFMGTKAFSNNRALTSFTFPDKVTTMPDNCFDNCVEMTTCTFGSNSQLETIKSNAFFNCTKLTSITIPSKVSSIEPGVFNLSGVAGEDAEGVGFASTTKWRVPSSISIITTLSDKKLNAQYLTNISQTEANNWGYTGLTTSDPILFTGTKTAEGECSAAISDLGKQVSGTLPIPDTIDGLTVTSIADSGCAGATATGITMPETVKTIGASAFAGCSNAANISLSSAITSIGENAFENCSQLTSLDIPSGVTTLPSKVCYGCSSLTSITLPTGLTSIGDYAFYKCTSLESVEIPTNVETIGSYVFSNAGSSNFVVTFTNNTSKITEIPTYAFYQSSLTTFTIPASVTQIDDHAFDQCKALTSIDTTLCSNLTTIGTGEGWVFAQTSSLSSFTIPASVTTIKPYAFYISGVDNVTFGNQIGWVTSDATTKYLDVSDSAYNAERFKDSTWYTSTLTINESSLALSVTGTSHHLQTTSGQSIQLTATFGGSNITDSTDCTWSIEGGTDVAQLSGTTKGLVEFVGDGTKSASVKVTATFTYKSKTYTNSYEIEAAAWDVLNCSSGTVTYKSLTTYKTALALPSRYWADGATSPTAVTTIGSMTNDASALTSVYIPEGITTIKASAFSGCAKLEGATLPATMTTIQEQAFEGCTSLGTNGVTFTDTSNWQQTGYGAITIGTATENAQHLVDCSGSSATGTNWGYSGIVKETIIELDTTFSASTYNWYWTTDEITIQPNTKYKVMITIPSTGEMPGILSLYSLLAIGENFDPDSISITKSDGTVLPWQWEDEDKYSILFTDTSSLAAGDVIWIFMTSTNVTLEEERIVAANQ